MLDNNTPEHQLNTEIGDAFDGNEDNDENRQDNDGKFILIHIHIPISYLNIFVFHLFRNTR